MKSKIINIILVLILLTGLGLLLYPTVSDYYNSLRQSRAITGYVQQVSNMDRQTYETEMAAARDYNEDLAKKVDRFHMDEEDVTWYNSLLDVTDTGIMSYVEIPKINVSLPIYHGTNEAVLQTAIGHLEGTSVPVGGESTHCVLSGHRGLPSARLFSDIDRLVEGDTFLIETLGETLTYEVDQIRIVLPTELQDIRIVPGEDYCTLMTCTPYGINTHRLLVRGHRIENVRTQGRVVADAMQVEPQYVAVLLIAVILIVLFLVTMFRSSRRKTRSREQTG